MTAIGSFGGSTSVGTGVNGTEVIVGSAQTTGDFSYRAFYLEPGATSTLRSLGTLSGNGNSYAYGINNAGQVVGTSETESGAVYAYRTLPNGGAMQSLGAFDGGIQSDGRAINELGQVTGTSRFGLFDTHAFLYSGNPGNGGTMIDLGTLGGSNSAGVGINSAGHVVGESDLPFDDTLGEAPRHPFLYRNGVMHDLGTLGGLYGSANSINASGAIVGHSSLTSDGSHAFLYTGVPGAGGSMVDLENWLNTANPVAGGQWLLHSASSINDLGYITGQGLFNGNNRAYLLDAIELVGIPGDANRDRSVNFDDLLRVAQFYNQSSGATWDNGDFNGDGVVDFTDLLALAQRYGTSGFADADFNADWAMAQSLVPEPACLAFGVLPTLLLRRRRRAIL
jgi:probable HAF family extracellular repeat protein